MSLVASAARTRQPLRRLVAGANGSSGLCRLRLAQVVGPVAARPSLQRGCLRQTRFRAGRAFLVGTAAAVPLRPGAGATAFAGPAAAIPRGPLRQLGRLPRGSPDFSYCFFSSFFFYSFMHLIIMDARSKKVYRQSFSTGASPNSSGEKGKASFMALDLISDFWRDCEYFLGVAETAEATGDALVRLRSLRVAVSCLFSHLDGVVTGCYRKANLEEVRKSHPDFKKRKCSLSLKIQLVSEKANSISRAVSAPPLKLRIIRDLLQHPNADLNHTVADSYDEPMSQVDVFGLEISDVISDKTQINQWLDHVCKALEYPRFIDCCKSNCIYNSSMVNWCS